jgi:hypothetical protein
MGHPSSRRCLTEIADRSVRSPRADQKIIFRPSWIWRGAKAALGFIKF